MGEVRLLDELMLLGELRLLVKLVSMLLDSELFADIGLMFRGKLGVELKMFCPDKLLVKLELVVELPELFKEVGLEINCWEIPILWLF